MASKKTNTSTSSSGLPSWATPIATSYLNSANQQANRPYQQYTGDRTAGLNADQLTGQQMIRDRAFQGNHGMDNAQGYLNGVISGQGRNPYLQDQINYASGDVTNNFRNSIQPGLMSQFASGGAFGGSAHQEAMQGAQNQLAGSLGRLSSDMRFQDWNQGQDRAMQASLNMPNFNQGAYTDAGALLGVGAQNQGLQQHLLDNQYGNFVEGRDWRANNLGLSGNAINAISGAYHTGSQTDPNPSYQSPWQTAAGLAATYFSGGGG